MKKTCTLCKTEKKEMEFGGQNNSSNWCKKCWHSRVLNREESRLNKRDNGDCYEALEKTVQFGKNRKLNAYEVT